MLPAGCDDAGRVHLPYGPHPRQLGDLRLPAGAGPHPVAVLLHGGGWQHAFTLALMADLADDLVARAWATWNLEFRGTGGGGGWPATFDDVAAGIDHLAALDAPLDLSRVVAVGWSAGGTLALWAAARRDPAVPLAAVVGQAPPTDLEARSREGGDAAANVHALLGGPPDVVPERYRAASPIVLLPLGVPLLLVHGEADTLVEAAGSRRFVEAARAGGDRAALVLRSGDDHAVHVDPGSVAWHAVLAWLEPWAP
jgi:dipeptidyl aminopeptidase/acylaminoacyl peptidase